MRRGVVGRLASGEQRQGYCHSEEERLPVQQVVRGSRSEGRRGTVAYRHFAPTVFTVIFRSGAFRMDYVHRRHSGCCVRTHTARYRVVVHGGGQTAPITTAQ